MSDFDRAFAKFYTAGPSVASVPDTKKAAVADASTWKKALMSPAPAEPVMPTQDELYQVAAGVSEGGGTALPTQIQDDVRVMSPTQLYNKYGSNATKLIGDYANASADFGRDRSAVRSTGEAATDLISSVVQGAVGTVGGIGALGAGLVNDDAGVWASKQVGDFNNLVTSNQSDALNMRRKANAAINQNSNDESKRQYEIDRANGGSELVSSLKRVGRDALNSVSNAVSDTAIAGDGLANGVGSLVAIGPLTKGAGLIAKAVGRGAIAARPSLLLSEAAGTAYELGGKAAVPAIIGATEAGGAYQQTVDDARRTLADRTDLTEDQKNELANQAGIEAAAYTAPAAVAAGSLVHKFAKNPFKVNSLTEGLTNLGKETIEEAIQGGTSQLATNKAIRDNVDASRDLADGVGEQVGLGALYGFGAAGVTQAPGATLRAAIDSAKLTVRTAKTVASKVSNAFNSRVEGVEAAVAAASPVAPARMDQVYATAVETAPAIQAETVKAIQEATDVTPEQKTETLDYVDKFFNDVKFDDTQADSLPEPMANIVRGSTDKFDAIKRAAAYAVDETQDSQTRLMSALYLESNILKYEKPLEDTITRIPDEHPALDQLRTFEDVFINMSQDPRIRQVIDIAKQLTDEMTPDDVSDEAIATPAGQTAAQNAVDIASLDPMRTNPEINDVIAKHAEQGKVNFTPTQLGYLKVASALVRADQAYAERAKALGETKTSIVSDQIRTDFTPAGFDEKSASGHMDGVFAAMREGNQPVAAARLQRFMQFAQHMQNKVAALNESYTNGNTAEGNAVKYQSLDPRKNIFTPSRKGVFVNPMSVQSIKTAQLMASDALAVASVANATALGFPQLGIKPLAPVELAPEVNNDTPEAVVKKYVDGRKAFRDARNARVSNAPSVADVNASTAPVVAPVQSAPVEVPVVADKAPSNPTPDVENKTSQAEQSQNKADRSERKNETQPQSQDQKQDQSPAQEQREPKPQAQPEASVVSEPASVVEPSRSQETSQAKTEQAPAVDTKQEAQSDPVSVSEQTPEVRASQTGPQAQEETQVSSIDQSYPNLLGSPEGRGRNLFKLAFTMPAEAISRLGGLENPLITVREALTNGTKFRQLVGEKVAESRLDDDTADTYGKLIALARPIALAMNRQLRDSLTLDKNANYIASNPKWIAGPKFRAANIAETVNGKTQYNTQLQQSSILAGLQWFLSADQRQRPLDDDDVGKIIGQEPTDPQVKFFNQGIWYEGGVQSLSDTLLKYWGVKSNPNVGQGIVRGVPEGVAKELIRAMSAAGMFETDPKLTELKIGDKTYKQLIFKTNDLFDEDQRKALMANPTMIEMASLMEPEEVMYVGTPPSNLPTTQLRNNEVKLTSQQRQMIDKETKVPYNLVPHMVDVIANTTPDVIVSLFGHGDLSKRVMNKVHKTALTSINKTVYAAVETIQAYKARAEQVAKDTNVDRGAVPIYYPFEFTSVNRLQAIGKQNPQANKLTRHVIMSTPSVVDMSQEGKDSDLFWLAAAQAWGIKVHKQVRAVSVKQAQAMANGDMSVLANDKSLKNLAPAILILQDLLERSGPDAGLTSEDVEALRGVFSKNGAKPVEAAAFYAAMEVARLKSATPEEKKAFQTSMYVEADGITDGPMNAMAHYASGDFTETWVNTMRKGGLYLDKVGATSNEQTDKVDLYESTANVFRQAIQDLRGTLLSNINPRDSLDALIRLAGELTGGDITQNPDTGEIVVKRGAVKNPLTVVIYGAGDAGIAGKIGQTFAKAIYERMTSELEFIQANPKATPEDIAVHHYPALAPAEAVKKNQQFNKDITRLTESRVFEREGELAFSDESQKTDRPKTSNLEEYEYTSQQMENLNQNILNMLVAPLQVGIQANIGETVAGTDMVRKATQVQSIYLQYAEQRAVINALDAREKLAKTDGTGWQRSDFLSQKELQAIRDKLRYLSPFVETGTQSLLVSNSARVPVMAREGAKGATEFSRSLDDQNSTGAYMSGSQDSGVSGIPKVTISTGDGQMMQTFSVKPEVKDGYMLIFDGAHFRLPDIENYSRLINQSVHEGWMENPIAAVSSTFNDFVKLADLSNIEPEMAVQLNKALTGEKGSISPEDAESEIKALQANLTAHAEDTQARKNVLARVQMSVDHMASGEAPYQGGSENGESLAGLDPTQAAQRLNELLQEERAKIKGEKSKTAAPSVDELTVVQPERLMDLARKTSLTGETKKLFVEALRNAQAQGYKIVTGSQEQIDAYAVQNNLRPNQNDPAQVTKGYTVFGDKIIYMVDPSEETLLHEVIHAATLDQMYSYTLNNDRLTPEQFAAAERIEGLMRQWMAGRDNFATLNAETRQAASNARAEINKQLGAAGSNAANKANAMNEFMAWVLSNQNLSQVAALTKINPIVKIAKDALAALKSLLGFKTKIGDDLLSNLRFNTHVLLTGSKPASEILADTIRYQSGNFGTNNRLTELGANFVRIVSDRVNNSPNPAARLQESKKAAEALVVADKVTTDVIANGFSMDMQAKSTFRMMLAGFSADIAMDANALSRAQELFTHVTKNLKVENFMADPESLDPNDRYQAQAKYDTVVGARTVQMDEQGRSTLVPTFLALATVDDRFRQVLAQMPLPEGVRDPNDSVDNVLTNFGTSMMERLSVAMAGERQNSLSVSESIDSLTAKITDIAYDRAGFIDQMAAPVGNALDSFNDYTVRSMQALSKYVAGKAETVRNNPNNKKIVRDGANIAKLMSGFFDKDAVGDVSNSVMSLMNSTDLWKPLQDFMNELVGRTDQNAPVYDMIKQTKSAISSVRQQFREHLPDLLQKKFSREVTDAEWTSLYNGMARTDLASLRSGYSIDQTAELLVNSAKRSAEAKRIEGNIKATNNNSATIIQKAKELAGYMNTGVVPHNLLRNSYAIANLLGQGIKLNKAADANLVKDIDHLVSLYAVEGLNQNDRDNLASLVQTEAEGVKYLTEYLVGQRNIELSNAAGDTKILANHYKGYIPSEQQGGIGMVVADDAEFVELRQRGYERVADYVGADAEFAKAKRGYYFSPVSGKAPYAQGIMQTVHNSVSGINTATGFSIGDGVAGRITDPAIVARIAKLAPRMKGGKEQLMPVFDENGDISAYERSIDPLEQIRLNKNTNLSQMMGAWSGRQAEEKLASLYNTSLIEKLHDRWEADKDTRKNEYVYLPFTVPRGTKDPLDKIQRDAVKLIPYSAREQIEELFGTEGMYVRRDMFDDSLGYRQASIGDAWTGTTRWPEEVQTGVRQVATAVFGIDAYKRMIQAEKLIQNRITDARVLIVVKSIVVPMANLMFNVFQLSGNGVPIANTVRGMPKKTAEIDAYTKGRLRQMELEGELRAAGSDVVAQRRYSAEIQSIQDTAKRMSIWPLIEAGEFSSVSDVGLGIQDTDFTSGKLSQYMETLVDRLPEGVKTAAKYAIVSKDTALFKGLQKTVEYGDFLAKAILYDDLTKSKGLDSKTALGLITEEFVNYDRLPGRARNTLDNFGLLWFWNFKVRSTKVAVRMMRNNPVHALLSTFAPAPFIGDIGSPLTDNIMATAFKGNLGNSIGPGQGFRAMHLLPWTNFMN